MDPLTLNLEPIEFGYGIFPKDLSLDLGGGENPSGRKYNFQKGPLLSCILLMYLCIHIFLSQGIEILGWCQVGSILPNEEKEPLSLALVQHTSSDCVTTFLMG